MYDATYLAAQRRVEAKIGFFLHLAIYLCVNTGLVIFHLWRGHAGWWLLGPLAGWGIGLIFHALRVFVQFPARWKQSLIEQELKK